jgi:NAD(P)-dependent dehydrogenase (short-subunit alcohol dehydrogenase family)
VAIVTGAGRGVGRAHALLMAREGAAVVVNDLGAASDGTGADATPAQQVVEEIRAFGGRAIANGDDVSDFDAAGRLIQSAVDEFGALHVLVNNAGILRDRSLPNMSIDEWDAVLRVHLRGHFCPARHAAAYWRDRSKAGEELKPSLVNTTSVVGLFGNFGQANYSSAKAAIAGFTLTCHMELSRYGVRANAISPYARTRLTGAADDAALDLSDPLSPAHAAPFVAYLASADCPIAGKVFMVTGGDVRLIRPWQFMDGAAIHRDMADGPWTVDAIAKAAGPLVDAEIPWEMTKATASEPPPES